jgi:hypothetical protein
MRLFVSSSASQPGFFVSSVGSGQGGNLGGLAGADKHSQAPGWAGLIDCFAAD